MDDQWAGLDATKLAMRQVYEADPKRVWEFHEHWRDMLRSVQPSSGYDALAELQRRYPHLRVITQNADDLHERAGNTDIIKLHGSLMENKCYYDCQGNPTVVDISKMEWDKTSGPPCPYCGRPVRPNVVWVDESPPIALLKRANELMLEVDVVIVIGAQGLISDVSKIAHIAKDHGAAIIAINCQRLITRFADLKLEGPSGEVLPRIVAALD